MPYIILQFSPPAVTHSLQEKKWVPDVCVVVQQQYHNKSYGCGSRLFSGYKVSRFQNVKARLSTESSIQSAVQKRMINEEHYIESFSRQHRVFKMNYGYDVILPDCMIK